MDNACSLFIPKMDNAAYNKDPEKGTELVEKQKQDKSTVTSITVATSTANGTPSTSTYGCRPEVCHAARTRYTPPNLNGSPWSKKKSIILGTILGALAIWIIIFTTLSQLDLL